VSIAAQLRRGMGTPIRNADQEDHARTIRTIRALLGDQRFEALGEQAATVPLEAVIGAAEAYGAPEAGV
jgi:hypothetical protein